MKDVVAWIDQTYIHVIDLQMAKHAHYSGEKPYLDEKENRENSRELRRRLLFSEFRAWVTLIFGEGRELQLLNGLHQELREVSSQSL